ncbi:hypothetical protein [Olleya sp. YS]|uniref:hypothetical protein n=1 Tax=Olleya sp. YS TaxID=3028318 RepID=UPI0024346218|nr:hypothetical protein [Olleya sp. YS]WGD34427.1 hypothetical protein Ollyesu_11630 [Olleya sp. YS]
MKKLVLLFTGLLMGLTTVTAEVKSASQGEDLVSNRNHFVQPILFVERGVEFLIFPDGSFDFNTQLDYTQGDNYYRRNTTRRRSINATFGAPGTQVTFSNPRDRGMIILHDRSGKVRRIGNVFLNYNRFDQIKRVGSVYIGYNKRGLVNQIGGMRLKYNKRGKLIKVKGHVNRYNANCGFCGNTVCDADHIGGHNHNDYDDDFDFDYNDNDDYYYYRKGKKIKKPKLKNYSRDK